MFWPYKMESVEKKFGIRLIAFLLFLLVSFGISAKDVVLPGSISGDFSVDSGGAATYSIPIHVSPGTAGMQPA